MLVKDLKKGMLVEPMGPSYVFTVNRHTWYSGTPIPWLTVTAKPKRGTRRSSSLWYHHKNTFAMYVGTKKDTKVKAAWSDKFLLIHGEVVAVDPSAWKYLKPVEFSHDESG